MTGMMPAFAGHGKEARRQRWPCSTMYLLMLVNDRIPKLRCEQRKCKRYKVPQGGVETGFKKGQRAPNNTLLKENKLTDI